VSDDPIRADDGWQRLDPRMLLVYPVKELARFLPVLLGVFVAGTASGGAAEWWQLAGVSVPVGLGVLRYVTTSYRIAQGRVELRRGLLNRHVLSTPVDRVRTVDVTAPPVHRLLGLTSVRIGTGTASSDDDDRLDLDGLPAERARQLRHDLLLAGPPGTEPVGELPPAVLELDPAWVRYAPFTSSGLVIAAGVVGVLSQVFNSLGGFDVDTAGSPTTWVPGRSGSPYRSAWWAFSPWSRCCRSGGTSSPTGGSALAHRSDAWRRLAPAPRAAHDPRDHARRRAAARRRRRRADRAAAGRSRPRQRDRDRTRPGAGGELDAGAARPAGRRGTGGRRGAAHRCAVLRTPHRARPAGPTRRYTRALDPPSRSSSSPWCWRWWPTSRCGCASSRPQRCRSPLHSPPTAWPRSGTR